MFHIPNPNHDEWRIGRSTDKNCVLQLGKCWVKPKGILEKVRFFMWGLAFGSSNVGGSSTSKGELQIFKFHPLAAFFVVKGKKLEFIHLFSATLPKSHGSRGSCLLPLVCYGSIVYSWKV